MWSDVPEVKAGAAARVSRVPGRPFELTNSKGSSEQNATWCLSMVSEE